MIGSTDETFETYDVCLSFADEQRSYVEEVAGLLKNAGLRVFYDGFETANLWGRDLYEYLDEIYSRRSRFCVLFASAEYLHKVWTNHERAAAQERALNNPDVYVLPVRFDGTRIPGVRSSVGYIDAKRTSPGELVTLLLSKFGHENPATGIAASVVAVTAADASVDCGASLRAVIDTHATGSDVVHRSYPDGTAVAMIPVAGMAPVDVLGSVVPALEKAVTRPGGRARIVLHRGEVPREQGLGAVEVTATVSAARALANARPPAGRETGCLVAISHRAHAELVRSGGIPASDFRKADVPREVAPWELFVRADETPGTDGKPSVPESHVSTTVHHMNAENVVFGVQVNKR